MKTIHKSMEDTYILTYRSILNWRWADNPYMMALWWRLLLEANFADNDWQDMVIKRGQLVTSIAKLSVESGLSTKQVRLCLERLKKTGEIGLETTNKYTIITICNYDDYQSLDQQQGQTNGKQTANEGQTDDKQRANKGQQDNKSNKGKESNKGNKIDKENISFVVPTIEEIKDYALSIHSNIDVEDFYNYYEATEWHVNINGKMKPMCNWKLTVQTWTKKDRKERPWLYEEPKQETDEQWES